jgi:DNA-binding NarL/FixJ family response regulator
VQLSRRECEAITALGQGAPKKEIAARWGRSENTVKATIKHAFEKLGVHDKAAAVLAHQAVHGICSRG